MGQGDMDRCVGAGQRGRKWRPGWRDGGGGPGRGKWVWPVAGAGLEGEVAWEKGSGGVGEGETWLRSALKSRLGAAVAVAAGK